MLSTVFFTVGSLPCNQVTEIPEFNDVDIRIFQSTKNRSYVLARGDSITLPAHDGF